MNKYARFKHYNNDIIIDTVEAKNLEIILQNNIKEIESMLDNNISAYELYSNSKRLSLNNIIINCPDTFDRRKLMAKYLINAFLDVTDYLFYQGINSDSFSFKKITYNLFIWPLNKKYDGPGQITTNLFKKD